MGEFESRESLLRAHKRDVHTHTTLDGNGLNQETRSHPSPTQQAARAGSGAGSTLRIGRRWATYTRITHVHLHRRHTSRQEQRAAPHIPHATMRPLLLSSAAAAAAARRTAPRSLRLRRRRLLASSSASSTSTSPPAPAPPTSSAAASGSHAAPTPPTPPPPPCPPPIRPHVLVGGSGGSGAGGKESASTRTKLLRCVWGLVCALWPALLAFAFTCAQHF